ncbi:MAG: glycoside hydrolase family 3 N-terminal domain-containing protein [Candidatus Marinimicrobia bacterium]|nr:glycoside hydrolase family 3 N-terminal domain-containing protein [Candidatus Neomarinimicrobiota bacterium]
MRSFSFLLRKIVILAVFFLLYQLPGYTQDELDRKIGQMVMVGFSQWTDAVDTLYHDIEHRNLGGVLYFASNIQGPQQIAGLSAALQEHAGTPLLIATDQEGGYVARLDENNGFARTPDAYRLGSVIDKEDSTRHYAAMMADWLSQSGINTNFAPVVDVNVNPSSPAIGYLDRSFSAYPFKVFDHASWFVSGFKQRNIVTTLKHFPGHGSAVDDSHLGFTDITGTWTEEELIPYREFIDSGYGDMIMTGHLYNAQLDSVYPASLSESTVTGLLRDSLGFEGVIVSDAMSMGAVTNNYGFEEAVVLAVNAGTDILLYPGNIHNGASLPAAVIGIIRKNVDNGTIPLERINRSYNRIMDLKTRIPVSLADTPAHFPVITDLQASPNPFNISTRIRFRVKSHIREKAEIRIYDAAGHFIQGLNAEIHGPGHYAIPWDALGSDGKALSSGTYIYTVHAGRTVLSGKMSLVK